LVIVGAAIIFFILNRIINHTKLGLGIRAVSQDERTAILMGVNVNRIISYTFLLGGVLAGVGSAFYMVFYETTKANVGFLVGISAFTAAVLGGIGNVKGALYGSFALGLVQQYTSAVLGYNWRDVVTFVILVLVLLIKPTGLFGEALQKARVYDGQDNKASSFNLRARFGDWWEGANAAQRTIFRIVLIGIFTLYRCLTIQSLILLKHHLIQCFSIRSLCSV
jgi:ABC-type uncharacterized transport system permease subunit